MRVLIICDLLSTFVRLRSYLAADIRRGGHEVIVVYGQRDEVDHERFETLCELGIEFRLVEMERTTVSPLADWKYRGRLISLFRELQPDMLLAYQAKAAVWASIAARQVGGIRVHVLFPGLGYLFSSGGGVKRELIQRLARVLYRVAFRSIDVAFFQNREDRRTLEKYRILNKKTRCHVVNGSGVPLDYFQYSPPPVEPICFLMATRLLAEKGIREFVEAARNIQAAYPGRAEFVIAGGIDVNPSAIGRDEIARWEKEGIIKFVGHQADVRPFLENCSVFVLPSFYMEGTPRSILEAMAIGRLIITTNNRGCKETVEEGVNGFLVEKRDAADLTRAMKEVLENPQLICRMGKASRAIAESKYDVQIVSAQMVDAMGLQAPRQSPDAATVATGPSSGAI